MKVFDKINWIPVCAGMTFVIFGCSGGGEQGSGQPNGVAQYDVGETPVADESVAPSEDPLEPIADTGKNEEVTPTPVSFPEPGTDEYWAEIIPGTWEEKPCVELDPDRCIVSLTIEKPSGAWVSACPTAKLLIYAEGAAISRLCLEPDGSLSAKTIPSVASKQKEK